jgi:uncharacterized membrane protein (GlpM family)
MLDSFSFKLLLTFLVGSSVVTFATVAAEKFGSKVGGFIAGLPSTAAIGLFFIGLAQSPEAASEATGVIPLIFGFNGLFLVTYAIGARWGTAIGLTGALMVWMSLTLAVIFWGPRHFGFSLGAFMVLFMGSYLVLEKILRIGSAGKVSLFHTPGQIGFRALFSGLIITMAVFLSKIGGPIWGGVFSAFPAVFISTLVITSKSAGVEFSRTLTKSLLVSASINVVAYALAVRAFYPSLGLVAGTAMAYGMAGISACGTYIFIQKKMA